MLKGARGGGGGGVDRTMEEADTVATERNEPS